ncbi:hypothetical protein RGQ21_15750 [Kitasatospora aureofaciens]|nr:hypothetical protein RGQ21_15750 [Kitasatospora aureofaciens]
MDAPPDDLVIVKEEYFDRGRPAGRLAVHHRLLLKEASRLQSQSSPGRDQGPGPVGPPIPTDGWTPCPE